MNTVIYEELLVDKSSTFQDLFCAICSNLIKDAHQCDQGHLFCGNCIKEWLETQTTCPACRCLINFENLSKNRLANNLVGNLKIYCSNGCKETMCIDQLESHLQICEKRYINCPQNKSCGLIRLNLLDEHLEICKYKYQNNCLYRNDNDKRVQKEEVLQFEEVNNKNFNNCNCSDYCNNSCSSINLNYDHNLNYLNDLQMKIHQINLQAEEERKETQIVGELYENKYGDVNHSFDWIIQNFNDKIKNMGVDGYFEIIPFEDLIIRFYPNKTEYFTTPCKVGVIPIETMCIKMISKCLIPVDLKLTIQSPISREVISVLKKDLDLDIKFDKINNIKSDLKLSFIVNLKKKYLNLFTS